MNFGLLYEMQLGPRPWGSDAEYHTYWDAIEQAKLAERVGFDYLWHVEHHFLTEYSHGSSPEVWLAAAAQHTTRIRIGHGVVLLPPKFNHPFHVAERIAALDIMSNGRVEFGTGRAATAVELEGFGISSADARDMWEEALHEIPKMWRDEPAARPPRNQRNGPYPGHRSPHLELPARDIWPKPLQKPNPPMWMAASSPESFEIAGRNGLGVLCFVVGNPDNLASLIRVYRDAIKDAKPAGAVNNQVAAYVLTHVAEDRDDARQLGGAAASWYIDQVFQLFSTIKGTPGYEVYEKIVGDAGAAFAELTEKYGNVIDPLIDLGIICVGDPDEAVTTIDRFVAQDVDQVITCHQFTGMPHGRIATSIELFGNHVIRKFADQSRAGGHRGSRYARDRPVRLGGAQLPGPHRLQGERG